MGMYFYGVCHSCRVYTMLPKCTEEGATHFATEMLPDHVEHGLEVVDEYEVDGFDSPYGKEKPGLWEQGYTDLDLPLV